ncbi:MAG: ATPase [Oscillospiraceae bacterium]|jgi:regulator of protease activity HflC (stomatin/prohibitin superfamily)|nr:ATPase [Oscillospiraceae bacterium]MBQ5341890.1 ATPase [Oscillospiraceae bacterium]
MTLDKILDRMDDLLSESVSLPLSNRKLVDVDRMQDLLDELRRNLPQEIKDAKGVVLDRDSILEQAENQAEDIIQKAEARARQMISEEEIFRAAKKASNEMVSAAQQKAKESERQAQEFSENALKKAEDALMVVFNQVKTARLSVRGNVPAREIEKEK